MPIHSLKHSWLILALLSVLLIACGKDHSSQTAHPAIEVTVVTIQPKDTPVAFEFVGQTESSHQVEIRSRVDGFLEKRAYTEGEIVRAGQLLFQIDRRPFEASLQEARAELSQQQARWDTARANLNRIKPLAEKNAVSKKDLDDASGNERSAAASVTAASAKVRQAELNLSYTAITSPVTGLSSRAKYQEGSYIAAVSSGFLTYVAQINPIWVNFSVSENEQLQIIDAEKKGSIRLPPGGSYSVEITLGDGSLYPHKGRLTFADPSFSQETGTYLVRAVLPNEKGQLRPGQFVRVRLLGAIRPKAILLPRRAVIQGAKGHFVWAIDKNSKADFRQVNIDGWYGDECFISGGVHEGDRIAVDGAMKLAPEVPVKIVAAKASTGTESSSSTSPAKPGPAGDPAAKPTGPAR